MSVESGSAPECEAAGVVMGGRIVVLASCLLEKVVPIVKSVLVLVLLAGLLVLLCQLWVNGVSFSAKYNAL